MCITKCNNLYILEDKNKYSAIQTVRYICKSLLQTADESLAHMAIQMMKILI